MAMPGSASSGEALAIVEEAVAKLPAGIGYEWTGLSRQEKAVERPDRPCCTRCPS